MPKFVQRSKTKLYLSCLLFYPFVNIGYIKTKIFNSQLKDKFIIPPPYRSVLINTPCRRNTSQCPFCVFKALWHLSPHLLFILYMFIFMSDIWFYVIFYSYIFILFFMFHCTFNVYDFTFYLFYFTLYLDVRIWFSFFKYYLHFGITSPCVDFVP